MSALRLVQGGDELFGLLSLLQGAVPECAETDPEAFHPGRGPDISVIRRAKQVCAQCPIKAECAEYAIRHRESGIWGGTTEIERQKLRAARSKVVEIAEYKEVA